MRDGHIPHYFGESKGMSGINMEQLIITCEACGNVKRYTVNSQEESDRIFREFHCSNECGRNLYSYITLGVLHRNNNNGNNGRDVNPEKKIKHLAQNV